MKVQVVVFSLAFKTCTTSSLGYCISHTLNLTPTIEISILYSVPSTNYALSHNYMK